MYKNLVVQIDDIVSQRSLLDHPFYQDWNMGKVSLDSLRNYAKQYYHFELAYPTFLSGIHHRCADRDIRQHILDNLWDEEHGPENHVELWLRFCDALGLERSDVINSTPMDSTSQLINKYQDLTRTGSLAAGAAALYAYESQVPKVANAKMEGLKDHYGIDSELDVSFFQVHKVLDEVHSDAEREMVLSMAGSDEKDHSEVLEAVNDATETLWQFLDGVYED